MPYNSIVARTEAQALMPEDVSREIIQNATEQSAFLQLARRLTDMSRKQRRVPVVSLLPTAYFVSPGGSSDTDRKQTTEMNWDSVYIEAEELAVIVPIPEAVLDDVDYDIWGEVRPSLVEAFGAAIDAAAFYGTNKPSTWPAGVVTQAAAAGNSVSLAAFTDLYDAVLGENGLIAKVEEDGFFPEGHVGHLSMRSKLRAVRDSNGQPIFKSIPAGGKTAYELDGTPILFPRNGAVASGSSLLITGDWKRAVYAFRQDITYKILTEAVIQDNTGAIVYNLAQQDMVALRAVMRLGWVLPNPPNRIQPTAGDRSAFGVLTA